MRSGGQLVVDQFLAEDVERVFCVPGESYLAVMDAMFDVSAQMPLVSCRHEGGAAMMAAASGQLSGKPGVAFVTRGPGATNASIAVHIAKQASIPLVLGVGQVASRNIGRESFQEVDFEAFFGPIAKQARQINDPNEIPHAIADAFHVARSGRCGPVVLAFPEDILSGPSSAQSVASQGALIEKIDPAAIREIAKQLAVAERPMIIVGGTDWNEAACADLTALAERSNIPIFTAFRRADIFDNHHPNYAGYLGIGTSTDVSKRIQQADCLIVIGARLDEPTTSDYQIPDPSRSDQALIHIHPEESQLGLNFSPRVGIAAKVTCAMPSLRHVPLTDCARWKAWCASARQEFLDNERPPVASGALDIGQVMQMLNDAIPTTSIITTDAGNFSLWLLRYRRYCRPGRLIAPINGAMGYGVPAAIAASLANPDATVIGCVGDGGMLMTGMELATAMKYGATPVIIVFNNSKYGTIEMHQQRKYPGREIGNSLANPRFADFARSFGAFGVEVRSTNEFPNALERARAAGTVAVIELLMSA
ncbi:MAG: acetolactate synthase-1/2/3 large subunit [Gammaproteobacteria bacterium]|jgi:acetolactate synthase-1/2/3 large subunit